MENKLSIMNETHLYGNYRIVNERMNTQAMFVHEKDAQEYIEFKNRGKIDCKIKDELCNYLQQTLNQDNRMREDLLYKKENMLSDETSKGYIDRFTKRIARFENAISIIKSLECEV